MPVSIGEDLHEPEEPTADLVPAGNFEGGERPAFVPLIAMEMPFGLPENFYSLPVAEQEAIKAKYRFMGIRMRHDIRDRTIPLSRETMDI